MPIVSDWVNSLWPIFPDACFTLWYSNHRSIHIPMRELGCNAHIERLALFADSKGLDVYFGVGLRAHGLQNQQQGSSQHIIALPALWLDIDIFSDETGVHASSQLPPTTEDALKALDQFSKPPTSIVHTGHGLHAYWQFFEPFMVEDAVQTNTFIKNFQKHFIEFFMNEFGWHVDDTATLPRVLRMPGTTNKKVKANPKEVRIIVNNGPKYDLEEMRSLGALSPPRTPSLPPLSFNDPDRSPVILPSISGSTHKGEREADRIESRVLLQQLKKRASHLSNLEHRQLMAFLLSGDSLGPRGKRDNILQQVTSIVAYLAIRIDSQVTTLDVIELFKESLSVWANEPNAHLTLEQELAKASEKLSRAFNDARADIQKEKEQEERLMIALGQVALRKGRSYDSDESGNSPESSNGSSSSQEGSEKKADAKPDPKVLRHLIIQHRTAYYAWRKSEYNAPLIEKELEIALRDDLAGEKGVQFNYVTAKGETKRKELRRFLYDYATVARKLVYDLTIDESWYDAKKQTFYEAVAPRRKIEPVFNEKIHNWLQLFGGHDVEKFLDWLATFHDVRYQTCALYCSGPPGAGKTMLAQGLSRLWTEGGPTAISQVLGMWNSDLMKCPLIVADEHIPGKHTTAELRYLIGSGTRTITRKYLPNADLNGAVRMMLLANNERMLMFANEDLEEHDIEAVAKRFLHIQTTEIAERYLVSLNKASHKEGWIDNDGIIKHVAWLAENRKVIPGSRFLVEGQDSKMHRQIIMQGFISGLVLEWIVKYVENPIANILQRELAYVGDGRILLKVAALSESWDVYVKSNRLPTTTRIGKALHAMSNGKHWYRDKEYWDIKPHLLYEWVDKFGLGELPMLKETINRPIRLSAH